MQKSLTAAIVLSIVAASPLAAHDQATAHYLGNEGVMVARGDAKILFDAFYSNGFDNYSLVPKDVSAAMLAGEPPYDGVDAVFVSHVHGDHFTAEPAIEYLRRQTNVRLYAPEQVREAILLSGVAADDPIMERVVTIDLNPDGSDAGRQLEIDGVTIDAVAVPHAGSWTNIQNYAWRVSLDDHTTVIHLGDADPKPANFARHQDHFDARKTHTAFPPYWFIGDAGGERILNDIIKADQAIGIHAPIRAIGKGEAWRAEAGGDIFTDPGEIRAVGKPEQ
ncbi:MAG: MBL fold metallo-hydrolase [Pseudomonadota bacterium]